MSCSQSRPITLRRSCQSCVKAKRRCDLLVPQCTRCSKKGIACRYINAPLSASGIPARQEARIPPTLKVELLKVHNQAAIQFLIDGIRELPVAFARNTKNLFIHPDIYGSCLPPSIQDIHSLCRAYGKNKSRTLPSAFFSAIRQKSGEVYQHTTRAANFQDLLAYVQVLVLAQCVLFFNTSEYDASLDSAQQALLGLARKLWQQAPIQLSHELSPRRAWLFAESVRRTIIIAHVVCSALSLSRRQYAVRTPFVDALPFDLRTALWDAPCEETWMQEASRRPLSMVSLHEFTDILVSNNVHNLPGFESLVLAACRGITPTN